MKKDVRPTGCMESWLEVIVESGILRQVRDPAPKFWNELLIFTKRALFQCGSERRDLVNGDVINNF